MYQRQASLRQRPAALITWSSRPAMAAVVAAPILKLCPAYESQLCTPDADSMVRTCSLQAQFIMVVQARKSTAGVD